MLLLIDAGNTRVKWGIPKSNIPILKDTINWQYVGCVARDNIADLVNSWYLLPVTHAIIANVAGPILKKTLQQLLQTTFGKKIIITWFISQSKLAGLHNKYKNPKQLGCDRFASAIGAHAIFPRQALIVATCGTVTTVDNITADGDFMGGMILPGLKIMTTSLAANTAQLPKIQTIKTIVKSFPNNTVDAMIAGCIAAQVGAIEHAIAIYRKKYGNNVLCLLTGGAAEILTTYLMIPNQKIDNLVLIGLQVIANQANLNKNQSN